MVEKRKQPRAVAELRVEYRTVGSFISDYVTNISRGGVFVRTDRPLRIGTRVRLVFSLPGMPFPFDLSGVVRWVQTLAGDAEPGMGIAFDGIDGRIQKRIQAYVEKNAPMAIETRETAVPPIATRSLLRKGPAEPGRHRTRR